MRHARLGILGTKAGCRDQLVELLTRRSNELTSAGCLLYEVGIDDDHPNSVFVSELWTSAESHRASLELPSVRAGIAEAMPLLSNERSSQAFDVVGSPLRD